MLISAQSYIKAHLLIGLNHAKIYVMPLAIALLCAELHRLLQLEARVPAARSEKQPTRLAQIYLNLMIIYQYDQQANDKSPWQRLQARYQTADLIPMSLQARHAFPRMILSLGQIQTSVFNAHILEVNLNQAERLSRTLNQLGVKYLRDDTLIRVANGAMLLDPVSIQTQYLQLSRFQHALAENWLLDQVETLQRLSLNLID